MVDIGSLIPLRMSQSKFAEMIFISLVASSARAVEGDMISP